MCSNIITTDMSHWWIYSVIIDMIIFGIILVQKSAIFYVNTHILFR